MSTLRQAAQQALEALKRYRIETPLGHQPHMIAEEADSAITALKQALAEPEPLGWITAGQHTAPLRTHWEGCEAVHPECRKPEQEPVAYCTLEQLAALKLTVPSSDKIALYTAPTPRKPIDDLTLWEMWVESPSDVFRFARAIEFVHGITGEQT